MQLLFRDNLGEVLAGAVPGERQMEAKLKAWLQRCHASLDKSVRFEALADARTQVGGRARALGLGWAGRVRGLAGAAALLALAPRQPHQSAQLCRFSFADHPHTTTHTLHTGWQAAVRAKLGEDSTAFERASDGTKVVAAGDVVRVNAKPALVGRVLHFTVPQVRAGAREGVWA